MGKQSTIAPPRTRFINGIRLQLLFIWLADHRRRDSNPGPPVWCTIALPLRHHGLILTMGSGLINCFTFCSPGWPITPAGIRTLDLQIDSRPLYHCATTGSSWEIIVDITCLRSAYIHHLHGNKLPPLSRRRFMVYSLDSFLRFSHVPQYLIPQF